jgi:hypothetical protein
MPRQLHPQSPIRYPDSPLSVIGRTIADWRARRTAACPGISPVAVSILAAVDPDMLEVLEQNELCGNYLPQRIDARLLRRFEAANYSGPWAPLAEKIEKALSELEGKRSRSERLTSGVPTGRRRPCHADEVPFDASARARVAALEQRRRATGLSMVTLSLLAGYSSSIFRQLVRGERLHIRRTVLDDIEDTLAIAERGWSSVRVIPDMGGSWEDNRQ